MITIPKIDVMKRNGEQYYTTLRNLRLHGSIIEFDDGSVEEVITPERLRAAVNTKLPSLIGRTDVRLRF